MVFSSIPSSNYLVSPSQTIALTGLVRSFQNYRDTRPLKPPILDYKSQHYRIELVTFPGHLNSLVVLLMRDLLTEYAYLGELAGLFYSLKTTRNGLEVSIRGYTSHIKEFVARSGGH